MFMGLGCDLSHDLVHHLFGCTGWIFDQKFLGFFLAGISQSSSPNSLVAHRNQNQCYALTWRSYADYHCSKVLELCLALKFPLLLQLVEMLDL
jgi:hypothetical protein